MLYFLYEWLARGQEHVPLLNLLKYLTFRSGMAMLTAYIVAVAMGSRFIRWMKAKQGKAFDIRQFHEILRLGAMPLVLLEREALRRA